MVRKIGGNEPHSTTCLWLRKTRILTGEEECRLDFWELLERKKELRPEKWP